MSYNKTKTLFIFLILVFTAIQIGAEGEKNNKGNTLRKTSGEPSRTRLNINNISTWIYNTGDSDIDPNGNSGLIFPKGSNKAAVFESGFVWGATINGEKRVGGSTYSQGLLPGSILPNGQREVGQTGDNVRIFRVRPDWKEGDMSAEVNDGEGTEAAIRAQYEKDWNAWPVANGAPFEDVDGNGVYNKDVDIPGFPGSNQTVFFVANDLDSATCQSLYGSDPMGIEMQATFWAYKSSSALGNTFFRKYVIINKSADTFEDMYVSMWSDPDLGDAGDDYSGCDADLSLMYTYNGDADDGVYGRTPPAVGFDFFQGPIIAGDPSDEAIFNNKIRTGYINLPMSVHYFFINSDPVYNDPDLGSYTNGTLQFHNLFEGKITTSGSPFVDPTTGLQTKVTLAGDPVTGQGWVDGLIHPPGDRRQGMVAGPFTMAAGDTQEVVVAELVAGGFGTVDRLGALQLLKFYDQEAQSAYDNFFQIPQSPKAPTVAVSSLDEEIVLTWDEDAATRDEIESYDALGYKFQGYVVYQYPSASAQFEDAKVVATYDLTDGIAKVISPQFDVDGGVVLDKVVKFGTDSGVKRSISLTTDVFKGGTPLNNGSTYYYAVTSYCVNQDLNVVPNTLESPVILKPSVPESNKPGLVIEGTSGQGLTVKHKTGTANASVNASVVDPTKLTGANYEVFFDQQHYYFDKDGVWKKTNYPDSVGSALNKPGDQTPSTIIPMPSIYAPGNTLDVHFVVDIQAPDYNWSDGVSITFPAGIKINSANHVTGNGSGHGVDGEINGQTVTWGHADTTGDGEFAGGEDLSVNINFVEPTFTVSYEIFDDGWSEGYMNSSADSQYYNLGAGTVNGTGTATLDGATGYYFKTEQHWNVKNVTSNKVVIEDQRVLDGVNIYTGEAPGSIAAPTAEGLQVSISGSYEAPINFLSLTLDSPTGLTTLSTSGGADASRINIVNYTYFGGVISSYAIDNFGAGTYDLDQLQQDYELRWTGVFDEGTVINGKTVYQVVSGGQMATVFRMVSAAALATHPLNPNPGTAAPFMMRIPFEVWNVDDPNNPYQVNFTFRDRERNGTEDQFYSWRLNNRMYGILVNTPYNPTQVIQMDAGPDEFNALATWVLVFYGSNYHAGDVIKVSYANPLQLGKDVYSFTAPKFSYDASKAAGDVKNVNVFPNPYYGVNQNEINKYQRYVTFNHLPAKATIRLFNMGGQLVQTIVKDDNSQFIRWNLSNENGLPVASGVYIAYIDMPELGKTKVLKVAIIQETQILDRF